MTHTILIVDDDPMIRKLITTTLEDVAGYSLLEAPDGMAALEAARDERPEIVFLDYDMPRLNGIETCRRLRSDPVTAAATIVMLTAASEERTHDDARSGRRRPVPHEAVLAAPAAAAGGRTGRQVTSPKASGEERARSPGRRNP